MTDRRYSNNVPIQQSSIRIEEFHTHLGDLLPPGFNYSDPGDMTIRIVVNYVDQYGRSRTKKIDFNNFDLL